jgi:hypothetical protein
MQESPTPEVNRRELRKAKRLAKLSEIQLNRARGEARGWQPVGKATLFGGPQFKNWQYIPGGRMQPA